MSTESLTTPVGTSDSPLGEIGLRNSLLDALTVSSGAIDAVSFLGLGKVFTAFMTGNVAFLGMAFAGSPVAPRVVSVLSSMAGFAVGVFIAAKIIAPAAQPAAHQGEQPATAVWPRRTTVALGVSLLAHLCFAVIWFANGGTPDDTVIPVLLAVWAAAMGLQSGAVRRLNVGGIFTTAATATFIFLFSDFANFRMTADERRRTRGIIVSLCIGATGGAYLLLHAPLYAPVLPLVVTAGVVATAAAVFRDREEAREMRREGQTA
jgi:uncharacterized membrane protein YoaK (UPF0700 family)